MLCARIASFTARPDGIDDAFRVVHEEVIPTINKAPGFERGCWAVDRAKGTGCGITFCASEKEMLEAERLAERDSWPPTFRQGS